MACPYFSPVERRPVPDGVNAAMLPLGDGWSGLCCADPSAPSLPEAALLRRACQMGYARSVCPHFPANGGPDAARFRIARHEGGYVEIAFAREKDHLPFDSGRIRCSAAGRSFLSAPADEVLRRQARAYLESYFRRIADGQDRS